MAKEIFKFDDLVFNLHPIGNGVQARMDFDNEFGVSVVKFNSSYGNEWEVAVMHKSNLTYDTHITNDVLGYQSDQDVTDVMKKVQALKPR